MGGPEANPERGAVQQPAHPVAITRPFYMAATEVTQRLWLEVMGSAPGYFTGCDDCPVEKVSWFDAIAFCNELSSREGLTPAYTIVGEEVIWLSEADGYRLPTEAEWEYACRAGTTSPFHTGACLSADQANFNGYIPFAGCQEGMYRAEPVAVGSFAPNAWGLHDMHGNIYEWCWDWRQEYPRQRVNDPTGPDQGDLRTFRGGCWAADASRCCSATRQKIAPRARLDFLGFRLVRSVP